MALMHNSIAMMVVIAIEGVRDGSKMIGKEAGVTNGSAEVHNYVHTRTHTHSCYVLGLEVPESGDEAESWSGLVSCKASPIGSCVPCGVSGVAC